MKSKKQQVKLILSTLTLALALAGTSLKDPNLILPQISVEDEPERDEDDGIRPLSDLDKPKTKIDMGKQ